MAAKSAAETMKVLQGLIHEALDELADAKVGKAR
jgi:hypothetical protein